MVEIKGCGMDRTLRETARIHPGQFSPKSDHRTPKNNQKTEKVNDYLSKAKLHLDNGEYQKAIEDLTAVIRLNTQDLQKRL